MPSVVKSILIWVSEEGETLRIFFSKQTFRNKFIALHTTKQSIVILHVFLADNSGHGFREDKTSPLKPQAKIEHDDSFDVLLRKVKEKMQEKK